MLEIGLEEDPGRSHTISNINSLVAGSEDTEQGYWEAATYQAI